MSKHMEEVVEELESALSSTAGCIELRDFMSELRALLSAHRKMVKGLEQIASRAVLVVWPDHYAPDPPEWALDDYGEASTCGYCNAWLTVVRPGKSQCDCCSDGQDLGAIARATLAALTGSREQ